MSQGVGSSVGALQGGLRYISPPSGLPPSALSPRPLGFFGGSVVGALGLLSATVATIGLLGGNAARDSQLASFGYRYNEQTGLSEKIPNPNTGSKSNPPDTGNFNPTGRLNGWYRRYITQSNPDGLTLKEDVSEGGLDPNTTYSWEYASTPPTSAIRISVNGVFGGAAGADGSNIFSVNWYFVEGEKVTRPNGTESPSGYTGTNGESLADKQKKILPPSLSATIVWGKTGSVPSPIVRASLGLGKERNPSDLIPAALGKGLPAVMPNISPGPTSNPLKPTEPLKKDDKKAPPLGGIPPVDPTTGLILGAIASATTTTTGLLNQIKDQTSPENQRLNAKNGSCDSLKSPSCTKDMEDRIKDPLFGKLDAAQLARDAKAASDVLQFAEIADNFTKVKNFLNNSIVDRALGAANFAMNVHNALMLSNALGRTLAGVVDTAMNLTPFQFADANTGAKTTASRAFSSNVSAIIINLIGQEQYVELTNEWKVANRIYQSSTSLLNKTERLLGAQSKVAQKGNIDVANIGNALRANGIVNPNSYPPMAATKEANTPPDLMDDVNSPLSSFGNSVRNLNAITKSVNSTLRNVSGIKKDFGKLADLTNKESKVRKSLRSQVANQAKVKAKFTFLQIKQIKATGKK